MELANTVVSLRQQITRWKCSGMKIAFVPTMGNLHPGHLGLVDIAKQNADKVVASIFVNPLQFGEGEDFSTYPRSLEQDQTHLRDHGCDLVFCPTVEELYPKGALATRVMADPSLASLWEGALRPGHFDGVCTVVAKLFNLVQPDVAVFGQKDFQQWTIIKQMVAELSWPVSLIKAPIARAVDGLALSSRNRYLNSMQRQIAPKLFVALQDVSAACLSGNTQLQALCSAAQTQLVQQGFDQVDYLVIADPQTLQPLVKPQPKMVLMAVARLGTTRLLDNIELSLTL
ncbi:pantoate--beta-alanine ligase [Thiomicrospira sp. R3]|uniref:pantoate--beta-alanine ligase n=1 Tax=Thiomicrospira sp. R3 TaxID=3035472 RepID=UPI00259BCE86|nr:pantoate--beta-alanine ligase [Thiomicrospira sp. R3]WFE69062.1 pantoate--beta-alanine ligase [Thiomicrospira sp. R3]